MFTSLKKFIAASLVAVLAVSAIVPSASAAEHQFTDVNSSYDEAVSFFYEYELIKGTTPTTFGTDLNIKRGDAAVILANTLGLDVDNAPSAGFKDLNPRVQGAVNALAEEGIISGVSKDKFGPDQLLSRGAMAKLLTISFGLEDYAETTPFTDAVGVFTPYIEALYGSGITNGKTATSFGTNDNIKRGEFANLLYNTIMFSFYMPFAESAKILTSTTIEIKMEEAAPKEYSVTELAEMFFIEAYFKDGSVKELQFVGTSLSDDRTTLVVELSADSSLAGKKGKIEIDGLNEIDFDYTTPVAPPVEETK
ncbi:S-layer homology domain-containing protein [Paenisporosarcina sp. FSL H8-0542]|uniref:S-layer homology domain-containing protein n=1 Tax=Paenisporosarcina sp. FSL H8-0542 TaxID=2921401 RepID=UPI00315ABD68